MNSHTGGLNPNKYILLWPFPIPDVIQILFTTIFIDTNQLIKYICKYLTRTDTLNLIIPLNALGCLFNDQIDKFPQVIRIDVRVQSCFHLPYDNITCWTIKDLLKLWDRFVAEERLFYAHSTNEQIKTAINDMIETYIEMERSRIVSPRVQIARQLSNKILHGFSAKNLNEFQLSHLCSCCKLIYRAPYELHCGHRQCAVCANVQKR
jgi:hypothetical protein